MRTKKHLIALLMLDALFALCQSTRVQKDEKTDALMEMAQINNAAEARRLIADGANVNAENYIGITALMFESRCDFADVANLLIAAGADVNVKDDDGITALTWAAGNGGNGRRGTAQSRRSKKMKTKPHFIAAPCPGEISVNGEPPLITRTEFWQSAKCRCLSKGNFGQQQTAVARPNEIPATGGLPLAVQTEFPLPNKIFFASPCGKRGTNFCLVAPQGKVGL